MARGTPGGNSVSRTVSLGSQNNVNPWAILGFHPDRPLRCPPAGRAVPIHLDLRRNADAGTPLGNWDNPELAASLDGLVQSVASQISIASMSGKLVQPTLSVT